MTNQELLDKAYRHMARQMRKCVSDSGKCLYSAPDGRACAIGGVLSREARAQLGTRVVAVGMIIRDPTMADIARRELEGVSPDFAHYVQSALHDGLKSNFTRADLDAAARRLAKVCDLRSPVPADRIKATLDADHAWLETFRLHDPYARAQIAEILRHRTKFQAQLAKARACLPARAWVGGMTTREAWEQCPVREWMAWKLLSHTRLTAGEVYRLRTCGEIRAAIPFERLQQLVAERFPEEAGV